MNDDKNKKPSAEEPENKDEQTGGGLAIGAGMGLALGVALGSAFGNVGLGIAFGLCFGQRWGSHSARQPSADSPTILVYPRPPSG
tara:strand:- start:13 stop:267 length:255 start_codon:yes stop_codon:yes gene_type:complete